LAANSSAFMRHTVLGHTSYFLSQRPTKIAAS
jgi:hypothetical protein